MVNTFITLVALTLFSLSSSVLAQDGPAASTFFLPHSATQFSVNIANDSSDVYFFLSAPAHAWVGFGFGRAMERSLMLLAYPDGSGGNVTVSPRMGRKEGEPVATQSVEVEILHGSGVENGVMSVNARCKDCRVWPNGFLDATSQAQDMIYAFGPPDNLRSDDLGAGLKRHVSYGHFAMDLTAATGVGGVPFKSTASRGVVMGGAKGDTDRKAMAHALLGCLVLFVVWPVNVLVAGFIRRRRFHVASSITVILSLGIVYGLGISTSYQYNRSTSFTHPHQLLALISLLPLALIPLFSLPTFSSLHPFVPRLHAPLSSLVLCCLIITGGLGLHLSQQSRALALVYTALSLLLAVFLGVVGMVVRRRNRRIERLPGSGVGLGVGSVAELGLLRKESREGSEAGSATSLKGFLDESRRDGSVGGATGAEGERKAKLFGGGTMPGPQYLLNMHPGVPVHIGSGRRI
ncbi:integral membrane protein [Stagonosporopsis vannaccii]|nr:integral membrane protein [Stagonosporopsis vannaccii]